MDKDGVVRALMLTGAHLLIKRDTLLLVNIIRTSRDSFSITIRDMSRQALDQKIWPTSAAKHDGEFDQPYCPKYVTKLLFEKYEAVLPIFIYYEGLFETSEDYEDGKL